MSVEEELQALAKKVSTLLGSISPQDAESMLLFLTAQIARNLNHINLAALELLKPVPVPPELVAEANRTFNEKEVMEEVHEVRSGRGFKLEDFLPELEKLADESGNSPRI
jgi:hypothetical protein